MAKCHIDTFLNLISNYGNGQPKIQPIDAPTINKTSALSCMYFSVRSLLNHIDLLSNYAKTNKPDIQSLKKVS